METPISSKISEWLSNPAIDAQTQAEIKAMSEAELNDAFYKDLEFGTGGLRGVMGAGSNRMNKYTVGMATQGLSNYLKKSFANQSIKVAIAHDNRNNSRFFAETTAAVFSANGIHVYLFEALRPTPELSFAIRHLGCQSGVVITASHNPKEYNGFKAYWEDGAQIIAPHDKNIIQEVQAIAGVQDVKFEANPNLIEPIGKAVDEAYMDEIMRLTLSPEALAQQKDLKIVFSSIHGTGITLIPEVLKRKGFEQVHVVEAQAIVDGNFPTVVYPNPEEKEAMRMTLELAEEVDADVAMATDPDADRVGVAVKNPEGQFEILNGNQTAALLIYYLLTQWKAKGKLTGKEMIVKTIVTTDLLDKMAAHFGVACPNTLTGFKFIAAHIREQEGKMTFIGGGEESYGYMIGDFVRDKDAAASCAMIAEVCAWAKSQNLTLFELLQDIYVDFGFYLEELISMTKKGQAGATEIQQMMENFRKNPPSALAGSEVVDVLDYLSSEGKNLQTGQTYKILQPASNVLQFVCADGTKVSARPSGTEPKIKFYISVNDALNNRGTYQDTKEKLKHKIASIKQTLGL